MSLRTVETLTKNEALARDLEYVAKCIRNSDYGAAAWRLADAGGELAQLADEGQVMGLDYPTGMGWQIVGR